MLGGDREGGQGATRGGVEAGRDLPVAALESLAGVLNAQVRMPTHAQGQQGLRTMREES